MPKKATRTRTPSRIMWDLIAAEMQRQSITQASLAKMAGVSTCTVSSDSNEPEKIPLWRLWRYFALLGIDAAEVLRPLAIEHAEKLIAREVRS